MDTKLCARLFMFWPTWEVHNSDHHQTLSRREWHRTSTNLSFNLKKKDNDEHLVRVFLYKILHAGFLPPPPGLFFSTARIASSNTDSKFVLFFAELSTNVKALILLLNFLPSAVVTNFSELSTRKSDFVPEVWRNRLAWMLMNLIFLKYFQLQRLNKVINGEIALRAQNIIKARKKSGEVKQNRKLHNLAEWFT